MLLYKVGNPFAVIDIGSNSVRLVVYDELKRSPVSIFNEKALCGLAKNMAKSNHLNKKGVVSAKKAIARFVLICKMMHVKKINLFATSAVRDAHDGKQFVDDICKHHNINIEIISGEREAYLAGSGIVSSFVDAKGVVGDLGGGSLELIPVENNQVLNGESHPIGPLRFSLQQYKSNELWDKIKSRLDQSNVLPSLKGKTFYAVGGAFRNIAKLHMHRIKYPLRVVHGYSITREEFLETLRVVSRMPESSLSKFPDLSKKRLEFLPFAAKMMEIVVTKSMPKNIVFSASGVREGYLFDSLSKNKRQDDVLISGCEDMIKRINRNPDYGKEVYDWLIPLFGELKDSDKHIVRAACILSEISCFEHTEYRGEMAYRRILDSSLQGLSHKERVFLAAILYSRYCFTVSSKDLGSIYSILSPSRKHVAKIIGNAIRLGKNISGSSLGVLTESTIRTTRTKLILKINDPFSSLKGETVMKRLTQLSNILDLKPEMV